MSECVEDAACPLWGRGELQKLHFVQGRKDMLRKAEILEINDASVKLAHKLTGALMSCGMKL